MLPKVRLSITDRREWKFSSTTRAAQEQLSADVCPMPLAAPVFGGTLEVGRPPGVPEGSEIDTTFVINLLPLPLAPGSDMNDV